MTTNLSVLSNRRPGRVVELIALIRVSHGEREPAVQPQRGEAAVRAVPEPGLCPVPGLQGDLLLVSSYVLWPLLSDQKCRVM